jgi:hypothetical protein
VFVIPRLDRGIQYFQRVMDPPVKPEDDDFKVFTCRSNSKTRFCGVCCYNELSSKSAAMARTDNRNIMA